MENQAHSGALMRVADAARPAHLSFQVDILRSTAQGRLPKNTGLTLAWLSLAMSARGEPTAGRTRRAWTGVPDRQRLRRSDRG